MILLLIVFAPLVAALAIVLGAPARRTALWAAGFTLAATILVYFGFEAGQRSFQFVSSYPVSGDWRINSPRRRWRVRSCCS